MESILTSIKKPLGFPEEVTHFDADIILHINSALMALNQIGIGPTSGLRISSASNKWVELLGARTDLEACKDYVYLKVRLIFDPPTSSFVIEAFKEQIRELECRLEIQAKEVVTP